MNENLDRPGIYRIRNLKTGYIYGGQAVSLEKRWYRHVYHLKRGTGKHQYLQNAWNKYGEDNFVFEVYKFCSIEELDKEEQLYLDELFRSGKTYNIARNVRCTWKGLKHSQKTKEKISRSKSGSKHPCYGKHLPQKTKDKISKANSGENHWAYGKRMSDETREKMSRSKRGKKNSFYGRTHSSESRKKISSSKIGKKIGPFTEEHKSKISAVNPNKRSIIATCVISGVEKEYKSIADAVKEGFGGGHIWSCCNGRRKTHKGYRWSYNSKTSNLLMKKDTEQDESVTTESEDT